MLISELIKVENISLELKENTKKGILKELSSLINENDIIDKEKFLNDLYNREDAGSTALEYGLAIPHVRSEYIKNVNLALGIKKDGIDFESLDNEKTKLFLFIATPMNYNSVHLEILAKISRMLYDEINISSIINSESKEDIINIISKLEGIK